MKTTKEQRADLRDWAPMRSATICRLICAVLDDLDEAEARAKAAEERAGKAEKERDDLRAEVTRLRGVIEHDAWAGRDASRALHDAGLAKYDARIADGIVVLARERAEARAALCCHNYAAGHDHAADCPSADHIERLTRERDAAMCATEGPMESPPLNLPPTPDEVARLRSERDTAIAALCCHNYYAAEAGQPGIARYSLCSEHRLPSAGCRLCYPSTPDEVTRLRAELVEERARAERLATECREVIALCGGEPLTDPYREGPAERVARLRAERDAANRATAYEMTEHRALCEARARAHEKCAALLDAAIARATEAEAGAAAMREAATQAKRAIEKWDTAPRHAEGGWADNPEGEAVYAALHAARGALFDALASDAGRALLEEVTRLRAVLRDLYAALHARHHGRMPDDVQRAYDAAACALRTAKVIEAARSYLSATTPVWFEACEDALREELAAFEDGTARGPMSCYDGSCGCPPTPEDITEPEAPPRCGNSVVGQPGGVYSTCALPRGHIGTHRDDEGRTSW